MLMGNLLKTQTQKGWWKTSIGQTSNRGIIYNAKRLDQLAGNILEGAKIENQTLQLNKKELNLKDILTDIIDDYNNLLVVAGLS
jgi:signal transduction histidine kinase